MISATLLITQEGGVTLAEVIEGNGSLQRIDLRRNALGIAGLMALTLAMKSNSSLLELAMDGVTSDGAAGGAGGGECISGTPPKPTARLHAVKGPACMLPPSPLAILLRTCLLFCLLHSLLTVARCFAHRWRRGDAISLHERHPPGVRAQRRRERRAACHPGVR